MIKSYNVIINVYKLIALNEQMTRNREENYNVYSSSIFPVVHSIQLVVSFQSAYWNASWF